MIFNTIYHIVFLLFTIYILFHTISYGIYEIKEQDNKSGGITTIIFTVFCVIFSNIMIWQN